MNLLGANRVRYSALTSLLLLLTAYTSAAANLTGTATNKTTNAPAAGDDVILLRLAQGMQEVARAKTDTKGKFTVNLDDSTSPHLVRVIHQNVTYHRLAPPGTSSVEVDVYDVAKKVEGISTAIDVMRLQAESGTLEVAESFAVKNQSQPPRTQMRENNYEFQLPDGAQIDSGTAMTSGGQPLNVAPVPLSGKKSRYAFTFPLRPGETRFDVVYHLPYSGQLRIQTNPLVAMEHFAVMLPKEMQFKPETPSRFQPMGEESGAEVQVATGVQAQQPLAFTISGNGILRMPTDARQGGGQPGAGSQGDSEQTGSLQGGADQSAANGRGRPGGGLGPPTDAPDPLHSVRWYILAGLAAVLAFGAVYIAARPRTAAGVLNGGAVNLAGSLPPAQSQNRSGLLLEALKEELFQLEVERQQGRITPPDYEKAKAALDQTLQRAIVRKT